MKDVVLKNGLAAYKEGRYEDSLKYLLKTEKEKPDTPDIHYYLGLVYIRLEDFESGIKHLKQVIKNKLPYMRAIQIRKILGYIYAQKEDFTLARDIFEKVKELDFNDATVYAALGYIYFKMDEDKKSIDNLKRSIEIDENNPTAHNSLGFIYADSNKKLSTAIKECEKALELAPDNPAYLDSLGWAYYKKGDIKKAKEYISKAMEYMPENTEIKKHFKDVIIGEMKFKREKID